MLNKSFLDTGHQYFAKLFDYPQLKNHLYENDLTSHSSYKLAELQSCDGH